MDNNVELYRYGMKDSNICDLWGHGGRGLQTQGSHTLPRMKFPTYSWLDDSYSLPIL